MSIIINGKELPFDITKRNTDLAEIQEQFNLTQEDWDSLYVLFKERERYFMNESIRDEVIEMVREDEEFSFLADEPEFIETLLHEITSQRIEELIFYADEEYIRESYRMYFRREAEWYRGYMNDDLEEGEEER